MLYVQPAQSFTLDMVELILNLINDKIILNLRTVKLRMLTNSINLILNLHTNVWHERHVIFKLQVKRVNFKSPPSSSKSKVVASSPSS